MLRGIRCLAAVAVLALTGCAPSSPHPAATPPIRLTHPHVLRSCPDVEAVHLDADPADVVEVRRCTADFHEVQGVLNKVQYVRRLASAAEPVLAAYAAPDESGGSCSEQTADPLILWFALRSGDVITARAPTDGCGRPLPAAAAALAAAEFETVLVAREVASTLGDPPAE